MAWLESNRGRLLIGFRYRGERCRDYLDLDDNRDNRRTAARTVKEIEGSWRVESLITPRDSRRARGSRISVWPRGRFPHHPRKKSHRRRRSASSLNRGSRSAAPGSRWQPHTITVAS